jgi:hypothetical protein
MNEIFISRPPPQANIYGCNVEECLQALQALTSHGDPLMALQHYFQKRRYVLPLADCWAAPTWYRIGKGKESTTYWRCSFQCPLEKTFSSTVVPCALVLPQSHTENPTFQQLRQLHNQWFGEFVVSPKDGLIYLGTKKNAKRSAALYHFYRLFGSEGIPNNFYETKNKDDFFQSSPIPMAPLSNPQALHKRRRKLSQIAWIHPLYTAGVRKLLIRYRAVYADPCTPLSPTRVLCKLELRHPICTIVESDPMPTKAKARDDAIAKLLEQIPTVSQNSTPPETDVAIETSEKEQLLLCDCPYLDCRVELPHWTRWDASSQSSSSSNNEVLLYRVMILARPPSDSSGSASPSLTDLLGNYIMPNELTRFGLLLPICQEFVSKDTILTFETTFQFRPSSSSNDMIVQLADPQRVSLNDSNRRRLLDDFYTICFNWKVYGNGSPMDRLRYYASAKGRHYTFVPLKNGDCQIDRDLIQDVVSNRTKPYLVATRRFDLSLLQTCLLVLMAAMVVHYCNEEFTKETPVLLGIGVLVTLSCYGLLLFCFPRFDYVTNATCLANHFLTCKTRPNVPFIATRDPITHLTALSPITFLPSSELSCKDLRFMDLMRQRHKIRVVHPTINLIEAHLATKISDHNRLEVESPTKATPVFLMPELIQILPMPRDFLFVIGSAEKFMMPLEIVIHEHCKVHQWKKVVAQIGSLVLQESAHSSSTDESDRIEPSLVDSIREATTVFPTSRFERLEFLGDRVLNYMVAVNLFCRNSQLQWSQDNFTDHYSMANYNGPKTTSQIIIRWPKRMLNSLMLPFELVWTG